MLRNMRRISRAPKPEQSAQSAPDLRLARSLRHLIGDYRARVLPTDRELDSLAEVQPADIDRAVSLWDSAQDAADTELAGLLDAKTDEGDG